MTEDDLLAEYGLEPRKHLTEREKALYATAILGEDAIDFLQTELGQLLRGKALQKRHAALQALAKTPYWRKRKIQRLQFEIAVAEQFLSFVQEAITSGQAAQKALELESVKE